MTQKHQIMLAENTTVADQAPAATAPHTVPLQSRADVHTRRAADTSPWWWTPCGAAPDRVNLAYLYDAFRIAKGDDDRYIPSGKDAHEIERTAARELAARVPDAGFVFRSDRDFLDRVTTYLVKYQRVSTIVVAGAGLPSLIKKGDLHSHVRCCEANARATSRASVIYVERDPLTCAVLRTVADDDKGVRVVHGDPWDPDPLWDTIDRLADEGFVERDRVALLLAGVMSFHGGSRAEVAHVVQQHLARLPAGAFLAMTHLVLPDQPEVAEQALEFEEALQCVGPGTGSLATRREIEAMIDGTDLVPPGIVPAFSWYPEGPPSPPVSGHFNAAVLVQKPAAEVELPKPPWRDS